MRILLRHNGFTFNEIETFAMLSRPTNSPDDGAALQLSSLPSAARPLPKPPVRAERTKCHNEPLFISRQEGTKSSGFFFRQSSSLHTLEPQPVNACLRAVQGRGGGSPHHPKYRKYKCASESKSYLQGGGPHQSLLQTHTPLPQGNKGFHPDNFALVSACEQIWTSNFQPLPRPPEVAYLGQHEGA